MKKQIKELLIFVINPELLWPVLGCLSLLIVCVITSHRIFFNLDEVLTYYSIAKTSFNHISTLLLEKINPIYYLILWFWAKLFSTSDLSLRMFSSFGVCVALMFTWSMLRRFYSFWSATLSTLAVFLGSNLILGQNSEARFYGLLLAFCAILSHWTICQSIDQRYFKIRTAMTQALLHGMMILVHPFGFLYSLLHTFYAFLIDRKKRAYRFWYYASAFLGWLLYIPFIPALRAQKAQAIPHFWIAKPAFNALPNIYSWNSTLNFFILALLVIALFISSQTERAPKKNDQLILILGLLYFLMPIGVWIESQISIPLFLNRYLIGISIGLAIFVSALLDRILPETKTLRRDHSILLSLAAMMMLLLSINQAINKEKEQRPGIDEKNIHSTLPMGIDNLHAYLPLVHYSADPGRYYFIIDWELLKYRTLTKSAGYKTIENFNHYFPEFNILTTEEFLNKFPDFIAITPPNSPWFIHRIRNNHRYRIKCLFKNHYLVETVDQKPPVNDQKRLFP